MIPAGLAVTGIILAIAVVRGARRFREANQRSYEAERQ